jgi:hypothetical protein
MDNFKGWSKYARIIFAFFWLLIFWKGGIIGCAGGEEEIAKAIHAALADSDSDGLADQDEIVFFGSNPARYDSDGDGLSDGQEICYDQDCLNYTPGQDTDPNNGDTDADGLGDSCEVQNGYDPLNPGDPLAYLGSDSDHDGIPDYIESVALHTNPNSADTDGDGYSDSFEVIYNPANLCSWEYRSDPTDPNSIPDISKVVISEYFTGTCTWIELYNAGSQAVALGDWSLRLDRGLWVNIQRISDSWGNFSLEPGQTVVLDTGNGSDTAAHRYANACFTYCDEYGSFGAVDLLDHNGLGVDYVRWGGHWPLTPPAPVAGTLWSETSPIYYGCPAGDSLHRDIWGTDTDTENDWSVGFATPGEPNSPDTDGDGLSDWAEENIHNTDPDNADTDGDGYPDGLELSKGTDPNSVSSYSSGIIPEVEPNGTAGQCTSVGDLNKQVFGQLYPTGVDQTLRFFADFSEGAINHNFSWYGDVSYQVRNLGGHPTALCGWGEPDNDIHLFTQDHSLKDGTFEFDYYLQGGNGDGGVFFRVRDRQNGYLISLDPAGWQAYRRVNGTWTQIGITGYSALTIGNNNWHHFKIVLSGNTFTLYEEGASRGFFQDSTFGEGGAIGLRSQYPGSGNASCIDNMRFFGPTLPDSYFDDFSDGTFADTFQEYYDVTVSVKPMGGHPDALCARNEPDNDIHLYTRNQSFQDAVYEFDLYVTPDFWDGGVFFRTQGRNDGYMIALRTPSSGWDWNAYVRINGSWIDRAISNKSGLALVYNQWFHYRIIMEGSKFSIYENGIFKGYFEDSAFSAGGVGMRSWYPTMTGETCIDNISVTPLPQEFSEDFYSGAAAAFRQSGGNVIVRSIGGHETALCGYNFPNDVHLFTQPSFGDGTFEFDYYLDVNNWGGVFLRAVDANNGYLIEMGNTGIWKAWNRWSGNWTEMQVNDYSALALVPYQWRHYKVVMLGGRFSLYEDGVYKGYFTGSRRAGGVGLRGYYGQSCIDNIRVIPAVPDTNYYCFNASAGQDLLFDVNANDQGSPTDMLSTLYGTDGTTVLSRGDDYLSSLDPYLCYSFTANGTYFLALSGSVWGEEAWHNYDFAVIDITGLDTDGDGYSNCREMQSGTDPLDPASSPMSAENGVGIGEWYFYFSGDSLQTRAFKACESHFGFGNCCIITGGYNSLQYGQCGGGGGGGSIHWHWDSHPGGGHCPPDYVPGDVVSPGWCGVILGSFID